MLQNYNKNITLPNLCTIVIDLCCEKHASVMFFFSFGMCEMLKNIILLCRK